MPEQEMPEQEMPDVRVRDVRVRDVRVRDGENPALRLCVSAREKGDSQSKRCQMCGCEMEGFHRCVFASLREKKEIPRAGDARLLDARLKRRMSIKNHSFTKPHQRLSEIIYLAPS